MEVTIKNKTIIEKVTAHLTWVDIDSIINRTYQHPEYGTVQSQDYQLF